MPARAKRTPTKAKKVPARKAASSGRIRGRAAAVHRDEEDEERSGSEGDRSDEDVYRSEDEEEVESLDSDALDEESDGGAKGPKKRKRAATSSKKASPRKASLRKKRKRADESDEDDDDLDLKEGQEVVGIVVKAPTTGWGGSCSAAARGLVRVQTTAVYEVPVAPGHAHAQGHAQSKSEDQGGGRHQKQGDETTRSARPTLASLTGCRNVLKSPVLPLPAVTVEVREAMAVVCVAFVRRPVGTGDSTMMSGTPPLLPDWQALATSLGIKRATSTKSSNSAQRPPSIRDESRQDELTKHAIPCSELLPVPSLLRTNAAVEWDAGADADGDVSMSAPVPGSPLWLGAPALANARLSMGNKGATTTIRLISAAQHNDHDAPGTPQLLPFQTDFDLEMGSPAPSASPGHRLNMWPASPGNTLQGRCLYPLVPFEDMVGGGTMTAGTLPHPQPHAARNEDDAAHMPGGVLTFTNATPAKASAPLLSNKKFGDAAASVLEEMNRRVAKTRAAKGGKAKVPARGVQDAFADVFNASDKAFAKAHEDAFGKMDSIATHYDARHPSQTQAQPNSKKRKSDALGIGPAPGAKRKSSAAGARVISAGVRKKMGVPGAFGADEDNDNDNGDGDDDGSEEDPGDRRSSKRIRTTSGNDVHSGQRVSLAPSAGADPDAEDLKKQKEREAIRRKLDANKARRRSSRGRVSIGGKPPAGKAKTSCFGFLASAKSLVRNVWNMGAGALKDTKPAAQLSSIVPVAKPAQAPKPAPEPKPARPASASLPLPLLPLALAADLPVRVLMRLYCETLVYVLDCEENGAFGPGNAWCVWAWAWAGAASWSCAYAKLRVQTLRGRRALPLALSRAARH
ncbi:predicted protein [Postia placenta Mad-698-R]|nr:predicted protein [Postia placenta Mad-698-R]